MRSAYVGGLARWLSVATAAIFISAPAWSQTVEKADDAAKKAAKDAAEPAKDAPEKAKARDTAKEARDTAKETRDSAREATREARDKARTTADDARDTARDTARDALDQARDTVDDVRDTVRGTRDAARDTVRDARDAVRDTTRDVRDTARDIRQGVRDTVRESRQTFRAESTRSADFGIWLGRATDRGLVISDIATTGAIARFGFRENDVVVSVNGYRVAREADFVRYLFADDVRDTRVKVIVLRDGREQIVYVEPVVLIQEMQVVHLDPLEHFGLVLDDRYTDRIVVWKVIPRTSAFYAGIRAGDVITTFHGQRVSTPRAFVQLVQRTEPGMIAVEVNRAQRIRRIDVDFPRLEARAEGRTALRPDFDAREERREGRAESREERREGRAGAREERRDAEGRIIIENQPVTPRGDVRPPVDRPRILPRRR